MKEIIKPNPVSTVAEFPAQGKWSSKSGEELNILFSRSNVDIQATFFKYDTNEVERLPRDIRGLRFYRVKNIPKSGIGGREFHRIRQEIIICTAGSFIYECEDLFGYKKAVKVTPEKTLWIPSFVMCTYISTEDNGELLVIANTQLDPSDPETYDTYSLDEFRQLQEEFLLESRRLASRRTCGNY